MTSGDEILQILTLSLRVAGIATSAAVIVSLPLGYALGTCEFRSRDSLITLLNTLMALPTVAVGLGIFIVFSHKGPLGDSGLIFTPTAIAIGDFILATPIVTGLIANALKDMDKKVKETAVTLGGSPVRVVYTVLREGRFSVAAAVAAGFGRIIAEVGSAMILGGNIRGHTRTLTTAIALETRQGNITEALQLGGILLSLALFLNVVFLYFHKRVKE